MVIATTTRGASGLGDRCECGKPSSHLTADPDSAEWGCRVPLGMAGGRLVWPPLSELSDPSATTSHTR